MAEGLQGQDALLKWLQKCTQTYQNVEVKDLDKSWRNGIALCALIHHFRPELVPFLAQLKPDEAEKNLKLAFKIAEGELGIAALIDPEDILEGEQPDPFVVVTYLSQFYHLFADDANKEDDKKEQRIKKNRDVRQSALMNAQSCRKCKQALKGATIAFDGKYMYHLRCFECTTCGKKLNTNYIAVNQYPYCELCGKTSWQDTMRVKSKARENENNRQKMQEKAFKNWINFNLAQHPISDPPLQIENLETDLCDGVVFIELIRGLYGEYVKLPNYNKNPQMEIHNLDNATLACRMLEEAGISDHFFKPQNIVDGDIKMIMGLLWKLIVDLRINKLSKKSKFRGTAEDEGPRQALMQWCQTRLKDYKGIAINDFGPSFQDGLAFLALVHAQNPEAVNFQALDPTKKAENLSMAFQLAEREFGIPSLLDVEDMLKPKPDERSVMAYVSEFVNYDDIAHKNPNELTPEERKRLAKITKGIATLEIQSDDMAIEKVNTFNWEDLERAGLLLQKDTNFPHFWRKKWFCLQGSRLVYYKDIQDPKNINENNPPRGYIPLSFAQRCEKDETRKNCFMIICSDGKVYFFEAASKELMDWWMEGLNRAINVWKQHAMVSKLSSITPQQKEYKEGYLYELNLLKQWKKKYVMLKDGILYIHAQKGGGREHKVILYGCKLEEYKLPPSSEVEPDQHIESSCFKIVTSRLVFGSPVEIVLKADTWQEMHSWLNTILRQQIIIDDYIKSIAYTKK